MRFVSFLTPDGPRAGVLRDRRVFDMRDPKVWLKPGDRVEVRSPQLGVLETTLA